MIEKGALGRKIFFLYPPPVLSEVVEELARREFEVYLARDHVKLRNHLILSPDAILFGNLDEGLSEPEWESYLAGLKNDSATADVGLGVISLNDNQELKQKYLMDLQLPCGFITLKIGQAKTTDILTKTLEANEARGRRKFVRAACPPGSAVCIVDIDGENMRAQVSDFSVAGAAMQFESNLRLKQGSVLRNMQFAIKGARVIVDGFVAARRAGDNGSASDGHLVVMFDPSSLDDNKREKLRSLVFKVNQANMDRLLLG